MDTLLSVLAVLYPVAFFINLLWEVQHSVLYTTCYKMPFQSVQRLLTIMSLKDAFWLSLFYTLSVLTFGTQNLFFNLPQLFAFIALSLGFAWAVEYHAVKTKRWEYAASMPRVLGVGLTPLLELAVTGTIALYLTFLIL